LQTGSQYEQPGVSWYHGNQQTPAHPFWQGQLRVTTKIPPLSGRNSPLKPRNVSQSP
jgi:hypothetical protein